MCRKNEIDCSCYIIFTIGFNLTKLQNLSTARHLRYSMKYTDFRRGALKIHRIYCECLISIKFLQYVTKAVHVFLMMV